MYGQRKARRCATDRQQKARAVKIGRALALGSRPGCGAREAETGVSPSSMEAVLRLSQTP